MKNRNGFVSNSSSSSFVINLKDLTATQIDYILEHSKHAKDKLGWTENNDYINQPWNVKIKDGKVYGYTIMNNFDMYDYMEKMGIDLSKVDVDDHCDIFSMFYDDDEDECNFPFGSLDDID